jgi:carbamoyl-phosphate synthase large subunit
MGIERVYKLVDTCAAEFSASTPYYYSTFEEKMQLKDCEPFSENERKSVIVKKSLFLGSGPNRIGAGDRNLTTASVHGVLASSECDYETIMINCNPETVSTDFDIAEKLYFEPVFWEHIYDIMEHEKPEGVIVQLGGQTALKLAEKLDRYGIKS